MPLTSVHLPASDVLPRRSRRHQDAAFNHCRVNSGAGDISRRSQLCCTIGSIESRAHSQLSSNLVEQSQLTKEEAEKAVEPSLDISSRESTSSLAILSRELHVQALSRLRKFNFFGLTEGKHLAPSRRHRRTPPAYPFPCDFSPELFFARS